jgi:hypothetical protein
VLGQAARNGGLLEPRCRPSRAADRPLKSDATHSLIRITLLSMPIFESMGPRGEVAGDGAPGVSVGTTVKVSTSAPFSFTILAFSFTVLLPRDSEVRPGRIWSPRMGLRQSNPGAHPSSRHLATPV